MKKEISKKKLIKTIIICAIFAALLAGLVYLMVSDQDYGSPDSLKIGKQNFGQRLWIGLQVAFLGLATVFDVASSDYCCKHYKIYSHGIRSVG
ncbi:MAG: hypothetical protein K2I78_04240 [Clostridia bacterium]|nr:hypothetical protein [Clostridia bacterium]